MEFNDTETTERFEKTINVEFVKTKAVETKCVRCGKTFSARSAWIGLKPLLVQRHCEMCSGIMAAEQANADARKLTESRRAAWERRLADLPKYREPFDSQRAIEGSLELWERAQATKGKHPTPEDRERQAEVFTRRLDSAIARFDAWSPSPKGLGLVGNSGHAKTRLVFTLLKRLYMAGLNVEFITATAFGDEVSARFGEDSREAKKWIERLARVDVFFYDDMGKEALTKRVVDELFNLIDKRSAARKPVFVTANFTSEWLVKHYEEKAEMTGEPILNRLRDCCEFLPL